MKILLNEAVVSEHGKVIQSDFKPGSVERSIDPDKEGIPQQSVFFKFCCQRKSKYS
jgi:hypothetical protein